jgi:hypothetical protein
MSATGATFRELAADARVESVALSHLSLELGHLYVDEFEAGPERLRAHFERVAPWARTAREIAAPGRRPRVSTCFLIDDYFTRFSSPASVLPAIVDAAKSSGLEIDYVARESGCATANRVSIASLVTGRLTALPAPGTNGSRPPALEVGWLSNGQRSPGDDGREAMRRSAWAPPKEIGAVNHSVFVDVELWSEKDGRRTWSCAYLAAVWQLLRLGILRNEGASVVRPAVMAGDPPDDWDDLPPVVQLNPAAAPFCAYHTLSVLPARFLHIEHAVRIILEQVAPLPAVIEQITDRSTREGIPLAVDLTDRIGYILFTGG